MRIASSIETTAPRSKLLSVIVALGLAVTILATYTFAHESGHALVGLLFGGSINSFSINFWDISAHVGLDGDFTTSQRALISVAGIGLPLLLFTVFVALVPRRPSPSLEFARLGAALCVLSTLLAWMIIPFLYLAGQAPGDDSTNFLRITGAPPLLVAALALALYVCGWLYFFARAGGLRLALDRFRRAVPDLLAPDSIRDLRWVASVGAVVVAAAVGSSLYFQRANPLGLPPGYVEVARVSLAHEGLEGRPIYGLTLKGPAQVSLFFLLQNIQLGPIEISMAGPDGRRSFFTAGQNAGIGRATVNPKDLSLGPGEYQVELTFPRQVGGEVAVYARGPTAR